MHIAISNFMQITLPNAGGNLVSVALASPNTQALQGASGGPQTFTLSALPPSSVMSASGNPPGSTLVSVIPSQGGMIQQQQGASQASAQQILEAGAGAGQSGASRGVTSKQTFRMGDHHTSANIIPPAFCNQDPVNTHIYMQGQ